MKIKSTKPVISQAITKDDLISDTIQQLKSIQKLDDLEAAHYMADNVLCGLIIKLGYEDVLPEYHAVDKWYA